MRTSEGPSLLRASEDFGNQVFKALKQMLQTLQEFLNKNALKGLHRLENMTDRRMLIQNLRRCMYLMKLLGFLFLEQLSLMGKWFLHRLQALTPNTSWNLLDRHKFLDLRAWTMKDDRFQDLYGKNLHSHRRPPQVPMPHMCIELLTTQKSTGGTSASRSLRNLSLDRNSRNNVGLSEGTGCRSSG